MKADRREVLAGGSALAALAALPGGCAVAAPYPGVLSGPDMARGHRLRDNKFPAASGPIEEAGVVIAGGGVAGLAAGWRLLEAGFDDFVLYELEDEIGGNARSGRNAVTAYPLGAHYLPVPNREAVALCAMLTQFGIVTGKSPDGLPQYDQLQLCADLEERTFMRGEWHEGLYPPRGWSASDLHQRQAFFNAMAQFRDARGADGAPAFASPMAFSSQDPQFTALDRLSFAAWLAAEEYTAPALLAHLRYCCRDDYGTELADVSAWAGIHYFAARRGWAADGAGERELTWPEGNGRLIALLRNRLSGHIRSASPVCRIAAEDGTALIDRFDIASGQTIRTRAVAAVIAMPHFVAARVVSPAPRAGGFSYAPWIVATITVNRLPRGPGVPLAWDNVSAGSESLGYVVATHQTSSAGSGPGVLTWYMPLSRQTPGEARRLIQSYSLTDWQSMVADDLLIMNPDLAGAIERIDIWRWAHAMIRPTPGFLTDPDRSAAAMLNPPLLWAHSDLSGLSLFEEAHYRGVAAAEAALRAAGRSFTSLL